MKRVIALLLLIFLSFSSCDKCKDVDCFTPADPFVFDLVSKTTGDDLIATGYYDKNDFRVNGETENPTRNFRFIELEESTYIQVYHTSFETGIVNYEVTVLDQLLFSFYVDATKLEGECCASIRYNEVLIDAADYIYDQERGVYTVLVNVD